MVKLFINCNGKNAGIIDVEDYNNESIEDLLACYDDSIDTILENAWDIDIADAPFYYDFAPQGVFDEDSFYVDSDAAADFFLQEHKG